MYYLGQSKLALHNPGLSALRSCSRQGVHLYSNHYESLPQSIAKELLKQNTFG